MTDGGDIESTTFEDLDFDETGRSGIQSMSVRALGQLLCVGAIAVGFFYDFLLVPANTPMVQSPFVWDVTGLDWLLILTLVLGFFNVLIPLAQNRRMTRYYWKEFRKNQVAVVSLGILIMLFIVGILGPILLSPPKLNYADAFFPPVGFTAAAQGTPIQGTWAHPLGTTPQGKDMLKLIVYGTNVSLKIGLIGMIIMITIGTLVGTTAAYFGGYVDEFLMRYVDLQQTFPAFMLLLLLVYLFGGSLFMIILLYGFLSWEGTARLVRSEALQRREEAYVRAAENLGANNRWIIMRHLVPNVSSTVITAATLAIPGFILGEASLSFVGLGDPNVISWGQIIASGRSSLSTAPWVATIPGLVLFVTVLSINFVGEALRDALDPRQET